MHRKRLLGGILALACWAGAVACAGDVQDEGASTDQAFAGNVVCAVSGTLKHPEPDGDGGIRTRIDFWVTAISGPLASAKATAECNHYATQTEMTCGKPFCFANPGGWPH
jgi:hypothetical protein